MKSRDRISGKHSIFKCFALLNPQKSTVLHLAILIVAGAILWLATCGLSDLRGPDEGRYAQISKELLERKDWLRLTIHDQPYDQKPPLQFWFMAVSMYILGTEALSFSARLPAVLMGIGTVLLTYMLGRRASRGKKHVGFASALILMSFPLFWSNVPQAELNIPFTFWITLAFTLWYRPNPAESRPSLLTRVAFWLALAAAFFTKGPLAFVFILAPVTIEALGRRTTEPMRRMSPRWGVLLLSLLITGWLFAEYLYYGTDFVSRQVGGETATRLLHGDHTQPFGYYFPRIVTTIFPWGLLLPFVSWQLWIGRRGTKHRRLLPFISWAVIPFALLCLANGKRQSYLLPLLPSLAVLIGWFITQSNAVRGRLHIPIKYAVASLQALVAVILIAAGVIAVYKPQTYSSHDIMLAWWVPTSWILVGFLCLYIVWRSLKFNRERTTDFKANTLPFWLNPAIALLLVLPLLKFTTIDPTLDGVKSKRMLATRIDQLGIGHLGGLEKAAKPEFHTYGNYRVEAVKKSDLITSSNLPDLMIARNLDHDPAAQLLEKLGYSPLSNFNVSGDRLSLFSRTVYQSNIYTPNADPANRAVFVLAGDTGTGNQQVRNIVNQIDLANQREPLTAMFLLGDNQYSGRNFSDGVDDLFLKPFEPIIKSQVPVFATLGNHDYARSRWRGQVAYPSFNMGGRRYYSHTFGKSLVTFFILDSESLSSEKGDLAQITWLKHEIALSQSTWKVALLHRPISASEIDHGASSKLGKMLGPVLNGPHGDIDLLFSGHNHIYERRKVLEDGILHITAGSGGKVSTDDFPKDPNREIGYNQSGVFVMLAIQHDVAHLEAINESGQVVDSIEIKDIEAGMKPATVEVTSNRNFL